MFLKLFLFDILLERSKPKSWLSPGFNPTTQSKQTKWHKKVVQLQVIECSSVRFSIPLPRGLCVLVRNERISAADFELHTYRMLSGRAKTPR